MENNFAFKKNDFVRVATDYVNVFNGIIDARKVVNGNRMYSINGKWHFESALSIAKKPSMTPTDEEMKLIKADFPILKKDNVKIIFEHGRNIFGFIYEKGEQKGKMRYSNGKFDVMSDKEARLYGYIF